jgi:phosphoribosyl 1,2-cyclic phosphodiesterase
MMSLRFSILASGSTGNAMIVENDKVKLMVDAGLSAKKIEQLLQERQSSCKELQGILITHEHADHIKGLGAVARRYQLPIYANTKTWEEINKHVGEIDDAQRVTLHTGDSLDFDTLRVESYAISHDAAEPVGYCFYSGEQKLSLVTDLGYVSPKVKEKVADSDVLIIESNHDTEMLRIGRYPWNIKRRILGDTGHLSNHAAGEALCELLSKKTKRVYLAHLSRDHNMMDLARLTVNNILEEAGICLADRRVKLMDTYYDRPTLWDDLSQE